MKFLTTWSGSDGMSVCGNNPPKKSQICSFSLLSKYLSNFDKFWWFYAYFHWFRTRLRMKILIFSLFSWKNTSKTCLWCFKMHEVIIIFYYEKNENVAFVVKIAILRQGFIACIDDFVEIIGGNLQYRSRASATGRKNKENHWYTREKAVASWVFFDMFEKIEKKFSRKKHFFCKKARYALPDRSGGPGRRSGRMCCCCCCCCCCFALLEKGDKVETLVWCAILALSSGPFWSCKYSPKLWGFVLFVCTYMYRGWCREQSFFQNCDSCRYSRERITSFST